MPSGLYGANSSNNNQLPLRKPAPGQLSFQSQAPSSSCHYVSSLVVNNDRGAREVAEIIIHSGELLSSSLRRGHPSAGRGIPRAKILNFAPPWPRG